MRVRAPTAEGIPTTTTQSNPTSLKQISGQPFEENENITGNAYSSMLCQTIQHHRRALTPSSRQIKLRAAAKIAARQIRITQWVHPRETNLAPDPAPNRLSKRCIDNAPDDSAANHKQDHPPINGYALSASCESEWSVVRHFAAPFQLPNRIAHSHMHVSFNRLKPAKCHGINIVSLNNSNIFLHTIHLQLKTAMHYSKSGRIRAPKSNDKNRIV